MPSRAGGLATDNELSRIQKRARRSANDTLRTFYKSWLLRLEEDNEHFCEQVVRFCPSEASASPQIVRSEYGSASI